MRKTDAYPSRYFKAKDFADDWEMPVEIEMVRLEKFEGPRGETEKAVVYFRKVKSGLVAGPVVWEQIAKITGEEDSDDWPRHRVVLFRDMTAFAGKDVPCIRVRAEDDPPPRKAKAKPRPDVKPDFNDSVDM